MSPVQQIELAMVARLAQITRSYQGLVVESYGAQLDDELFAWVRTLPATWVTFDKVDQVQRVGRHSFRTSGSFEVLVAQRALVENERRFGGPGSAQNVGAYQLLEDNKLALVNQSLGLRIAPLTPGPIRSVMKGLANRDAVAVYAQTFTTRWMEEFPDDESAYPDLLRIGLNYLIKPGDEEIDTSDLVTLKP